MADDLYQQFQETCQRGLEQAQRELKEVDLLIQQTASEVDRLVQQNARAVARVRQVESQFDTIPRDDIKTAYTSLVENQQRLFTMRGQLEKLQSEQKGLTRLMELYQKILATFAPAERTQTAVVGDATTPQAMVISIIEAQERERQRLSRQMHDGPAQSLTNLVLQAEICERLFDRDPSRAKTELATLKESMVATFQKVRGFIFELRPMMLDDLGLIPTLKRYVEGLSDTGYSGAALTVTGKERRLAAHKEVTVFRVTQELIHISREYARASSIKIAVDMGEDQVRVNIEDNGSGFELDEGLTTPDASRFSLVTLRERIEMLGGRINFDSAVGRGTRVNFFLPLEKEER